MRFDFVFVALLFSLASFLIFAVVFIFTRKELLVGIRLMGLLAVDIILYLIGESGAILSDTENSILLFSHIQMIGYLFIPTVWFIISAQQRSKNSKFTNQQLMLFSIVPLLGIHFMLMYPWIHTTNIFWYNQFFFSAHELIFNSNFGSGFVGIVFTKGIAYYIIAGYNLILAGLSVRNYLKTLRQSTKLDGRNLYLPMFASFVLIILLILTLMSNQTSLVDIGPVISGILLFVAFYGLYKYELFDLTPMAYHQVFQNASFPVFILDRNQFVISMNSEGKALYNHQFDFSEKITISAFDQFDSTFSSDLLNQAYHESRFVVNGKEIYYLVKLEKLLKQNRLMGYLITYRDITMHKLEMKSLEHMATYDDLTQILNRRVFYVRAADLFDEAVIHKKSVSFIMFDIDEFKDVNDIYGHQAGDYILSEMAQLISKEIDSQMVFARYGGEEFIMFRSGMAPIDAYDVANHLRKLLEEKAFIYEKHRIKITASFGVSGSDKQITKSFEQFLKDADDALYESKHAGKNQVSVKE